LDTGKCGSLREIGQTDIRDILNFLVEYPKWKAEEGIQANQQRMYGEETEFA